MFTVEKFRPAVLPDTLVQRPALHDRLTAGAGKRLTVVVGSAGAGKSVLLSSWATARAPDVTTWLCCDEADRDPIRFWSGFVEAIRVVTPSFGEDAAALLARREVVSADVVAAIANDAARLPVGSAIVVDDFHLADATTARDMAHLVERWRRGPTRLILSSRFDPQLRLHRLRMASELWEVRDRDLQFTLAESRTLFANFGVDIDACDLALVHQRSEGWAAALQIAALSLRTAKDPAHVARSPEVRNHEIAEYFVAEVLDQQPPEIVRFMLDTSVLNELTAETCAAVTARPDAEALLRRIHRAHLFLVALDDERSRFRYHELARQLLRAELRVRDRAREQALQRRAAQWFESAGNTRRAARHLLAAQQPGRALALLEGGVVTDFLRDPALPPPDLGMIDGERLTDEPDRLLALATDLLLSGDAARGGQCLATLGRLQASVLPSAAFDAGLAAARSLHHMLTGRVAESVTEALAVHAIHEETQSADEWNATVPLILLHAYAWLDDFCAVERTAAALAVAPLSEPVRSVVVPGSLAVCWFEAGRLSEAADAAEDAEKAAWRLGFGQHFLATDFLRVLAGLALERRDLDTAERLTEQALTIGRQQPLFEFLAMLDGAAICRARGQVSDALTSVDAARQVLAGTGSVLHTRADELEALLRLQLGDLRAATELADRLPAVPRHLLLSRTALAAGDYAAARRHLQALSQDDLTPRRALERQLLLAALAVRRSDPMTASIVANALMSARRGGFCDTVLTIDPELTTDLIEHAAPRPPDPFTEGLIAAALEVRSAQPRPCRAVTEPLTPAERRVLELLPTSTCPHIAATLYVSLSTVKTHLRSIYRKLGASSRSEALGRAVDLQWL